MSQPTPYVPANNFAEYQTLHSDAPFNGALLDQELAALYATISALVSNIGVIQRDDTALRNLTVHPNALSASVRALISSGAFSIDAADAAWITATEYPTGRVVEHSGVIYLCVEAHTSGTFATDLAAIKWAELGNVNITVAAGNVQFTPAAGIVATDVQAAIQELAPGKAAASLYFEGLYGGI